MRVRAALLALTLPFWVACNSADPGEMSLDLPTVDGEGGALAAAPAELPSADDAPMGDAERGRALAATFECQRCHEGTDLPPMVSERHCVRCHQEVVNGRFHEKPDHARWQKELVPYQFTPSLKAVGERYRTDFLVSYLLSPEDLRPALVPTMPRLALSREDALDIAAYLSQGATPAEPVSLAGANPAAGRRVMDEKECGACHTMTGVSPLAGGHGEAVLGEEREAVALAPDLRHVRDKFAPAELLRWLRDPAAVKADTPMPKVPMTDIEARDVAAYLLTVPLDLPDPPSFARLPLLTRRVRFEEVEREVLGKTCRHCHGNPAGPMKDGGPGNTGGFGFAPKRLQMTSYEALAAGYVDGAGERHSVFEPLSDGTPRLVAALLARHDEVRGAPRSDVRGMPLGLPALSPEAIQLVESWVAQGRPR